VYNSHGTIRDNVTSENRAQCSGGGLHYCHGTIQNNLITGNSTNVFGGGLSKCEGTILNCIIWGNSAPTSPQISASDLPTYSCIQDWTKGGEGNTADDPGFLDADGPDDDPSTYEDNDYRLAAASPCIDTGRKEDSLWETVDLDGNLRILPGDSVWKVDMGAYEYVSPTYTYMDYIRKSDDGIQLIWTSQEGEAYTVLSCLDLDNGTWTEQATVDSQGVATSWTDTLPPQNMKFYRVESN